MDENAFNALQMAFAVMVFVVALSISISFFSQARVTVVAVMQNNDREIWSENLDYTVDQTQRIVGLETIIPTIYRCKSENYKIYFFNSDNSPFPILKKDGQVINYISIDSRLDNKGDVDNLLSSALAASNEKYYEFLDIFIGGTNSDPQKEAKKSEYESMGFDFSLGTLYNILQGKQFEEKLGEYYIDPENTVESMKSNKRVITYVLK